MATPSEIIAVRENTNEHAATPWTDEDINELITSTGSVDLASAVIWRKKAAKYADLVDTSEAGASRKLSDLHKAALLQAAQYEKAGGTDDGTFGPAQVHVIERIR